jgi:sterol desaturase/sphingolipid hydroxylase (fatty acid hydroxylase superfamily)
MNTTARLLLFLGGFILFASLETLFPRRPRQFSRRLRWINNFGIIAAGNVLTRGVLLFIPAAVAEWGGGGWQGIGSLNLPDPLETMVMLLLLDMVIYFQHRLFHRIPLLWRLHRMHHLDLDLDVTSGIRFHPLEILLSMMIKSAAALLIGADGTVVLLFEAIVNLSSMGNHANWRIRPGADRILRLFWATPDYHLVHHSVYREESDKNYCFTIPWWDWLFGSYLASPRDGLQEMRIGVKGWIDELYQRFPAMLRNPFVGSAGQKRS